MSAQTFYAVLLFSVVMAFTPGPNNMMLASSGATYGIRRTLPHLAGVTAGFPVMILLVGLGLASILLASPKLQLVMKIASCAYLLWLAAQIGRSRATGHATSVKPMSFLAAAAFQWINPKAWLYAVGAISAYTNGSGPQLYRQVVVIALLNTAVSFASTATWTAFGAGIRRFLRTQAKLRLFNLAMALLLTGSVIPILIEIRNSL
ncbi:MAG TPA: LysE family translocator [Rhizomicrobium sp.]|nr:LysE family translocator [Rhizomicrobium sp.]